MRKTEIIKKIIAASLCAAMTFSLAACGTSGASSDAANSNTGSAPANDTQDNSAAESEQKPAESTETPAESAEQSAPAADIPEDTPYTLGGELTPAMIARSRYNEGNKVRLAKVIKKLQAGENVTVAYIGGSITQGVSAGNEKCYARLTTNWLEEKFPDAKINYVNAGIGATGSYLGVHRADADVLAKNPDLVFVEFSVNDTTERTEINKEAYASLLRKIWEYSTSPAIVTIAMTQENGTSFQEYHGEINKAFDLPMVSYKNVILNIIENGYIEWKQISDDDIHPNVEGHALLSKLITNYLDSVIADVDNISGDESDFSASPDLGTKYAKAKLLTSADTEPTQKGAFEVYKGAFGGFNDPWLARKGDGAFTESDAIVFEFEGTNAGLLFGKLTKNAVKADVYIDDELATTIDANFPNGWGNYAEFAEIKTGLSEGKHTLKIQPLAGEGASAFYVIAPAIS